MIERIRNRNGYQKFILIVLGVMVLGFTFLYIRSTSRKGWSYDDGFLLPVETDGKTVWSGTVRGRQSSFTVYPDKTVEFMYGSVQYGPYRVKEDPTAVPVNQEMHDAMTGIEVRRKDEIVFRGGMIRTPEGWHLLYNEDGSDPILSIMLKPDGTYMDADGRIVDPVEPSVYTILTLIDGPKPEHRGHWGIWFCGLILCIFTAVHILFADELFRWRLHWTILNAYHAEPTEWEIMSRCISWTLIPIVALIIFAVGLKEIV